MDYPQLDMVKVYFKILEAPTMEIAGKIFNAGYENLSVTELAETVRDVIGDDIKLKFIPTNDNRSYHISSEKIRKELGFVAQHSIREAVMDLVEAFKQNKLPNSLTDEKYFNIKRMQSVKLN